MTPNQRLLVAVALSVIFFVGYTAIFPPVQIEEQAKNDKVELKQDSNINQNSVVENTVGHEISAQDKIAATASSDIVTITSKDFILKIDTLGRIS